MTLQESSGESGLFVTSARYLMRGEGVRSLATLEPAAGNPCASMMMAATETGRRTAVFISRLAWHSRDPEADPRASILFTGACEAPARTSAILSRRDGSAS